MTVGSLKQQICYPVLEDFCDDLNEEKIGYLLKEVDMEDILSFESMLLLLLHLFPLISRYK
jgi:hypothetical protein